MFEGAEKKPFKEIMDEVISEANYIEGYGRYIKKHRDKGDDTEDYYLEWIEEGQRIVRESRAIRQMLNGIRTEVDDLLSKWQADVAAGEWTDEEAVEAQRIFMRDALRLKKKFVSEAWRVVELRNPLEQALMYLDLQPRRKYQRKPEEDGY